MHRGSAVQARRAASTSMSVRPTMVSSRRVVSLFSYGFLSGGCDKHSSCTNTIGSFTCGDCQDGWRGHGHQKCEDIDECKEKPSVCDPQRPCGNTPGTFVCGPCMAGY